MEHELFDRLEASGRLPPPPSDVVRLLELTHRADVTVREDRKSIRGGVTLSFSRVPEVPLVLAR